MEALVIGAGIIGLTTACTLQEAGHPVRIVAQAPPEATTSAVAGAVWYPYRAYPQDAVLRWSRHTLDVLYDEARDPESGVLIRPLVELFPTPTADPWWRQAVRTFRRAEPGERRGFADGYVTEAPVIDVPVYLRGLLRRFQERGGAMEVRPDGLATLDAVARPDRVVVLCAGLGAQRLAGDDTLMPVRGQVVRVANPGLTTTFIDEHGPHGITYVIPRRHDCILGGTADEGATDGTPDPAVTARILEAARALEPRLHDAEVLEVRVGLRPVRPAVRLEPASGFAGPVLCNYGHGGAGFTLAWGCAAEVRSQFETLCR